MLFFSRSTSELFSQLAIFEPFLCRFQPYLATKQTTDPDESHGDLPLTKGLPVFFVGFHQEARPTTITKDTDISIETPFQPRI